MSAARKPELTPEQRVTIERAREVATASPETLAPGKDGAMMYGVALGVTQANMQMLLAVIDQLTGGAA